jgi:hypothetical protein
MGPDQGSPGCPQDGNRCLWVCIVIHMCRESGLEVADRQLTRRVNFLRESNLGLASPPLEALDPHNHKKNLDGKVLGGSVEIKFV